jgi:SAM-dependent methyltransferase
MTSMLHKLFFNFWYLGNPPWDTGISPPELLRFINNHPAGRALDLGCGTGTNAITLAKNGWQATGVDFAPRAIRSARQKAKRVGVKVDLHVQDVSRLESIPGPFDLILDIGCLHGLTLHGKQAYINNLTRLLALQGSYLLYAFLKDSKDSGTGLSPEDLDILSSQLDQVERIDGRDRGAKPSAWLTFQRTSRHLD